jgi:NADPH:quinone reductase
MSAEKTKALHVASKANGINNLILDLIDQAMPSHTPDQVVVRVMAAAINPSDVKATLGIMPHAVFPRTPGRDFAGLIESGPTQLIGQKVWGSGGDIGITRNGSHANFLVLPVLAVHQSPSNLSMEEAGSVGVPFVTACEGFHRAGGVHQGQTVVVLGANGKVGQAAVQIAARAGARVIAVQRKDELIGFSCAKVDIVNSATTDATQRILEITNGKGSDLVFNTVDKVYWETANAVMGKGATQIFIIATKGDTVPFDVFKFYRSMHNFVGVDTLALDCVYSTQLLSELKTGFEDGTLQPYPVSPADVLPFAKAYQGYANVLAGANNRTVLKPSAQS